MMENLPFNLENILYGKTVENWRIVDCTLTTGQKRLGESDGVIMTLLNK